MSDICKGRADSISAGAPVSNSVEAARLLHEIFGEANPRAFMTGFDPPDTSIVIDGKFDLGFVASEFLKRSGL
jgi:hypothetical protein